MINCQCRKCGKIYDAEPDDAGFVKCPACRTELNVYDLEFDLPEGYEIGGYSVIKVLGGGSTGKVYLAQRISDGEKVALKVLSKEYAHDEKTLSQFQHEVDIMNEIAHPNIVFSLESGEQDGVYYLAMEYVSGKTLEQYLQNDEPLPQTKALKYILDIAAALDEIWQKLHIFHRDIKPANIIIKENDQPVLLDLGIAVKIEDANVQNDIVEGSPFYMSPEQATGNQLTWSTDLYSLGATLYHAVVGKVPYEDDAGVEAILEKHCTAPFPDPAKRNPNVKVDPEVVSLLERMLEKKPEDRFESWDEFVAAGNLVLEHLQKIEQAPEQPAQTESTEGAQPEEQTPADDMPKKKRRLLRLNPRKKKLYVRLFMITNAVIALLLILGGTYVWYVHSSTSEAEAMLKTAETELAQANSNRNSLDAAAETFQKLDKYLQEHKFVKNSARQQIRNAREKEEKILSQLKKEAADTEKAFEEFSALSKEVDDFLEKLPEVRKKGQDTVKLIKEIENKLNVFEKQTGSISVSASYNKDMFLSIMTNLKKVRDRFAANAVVKEILAAEAKKTEKKPEPPPRETAAAAQPEEDDDEEEEERLRQAALTLKSKKKKKTYEEALNQAYGQIFEKLIKKIRNRDGENLEKLIVVRVGQEPETPEERRMERSIPFYIRNIQDLVKNVRIVNQNIPLTTRVNEKSIRKAAEGTKGLFAALLLNGCFDAALAEASTPDEKEMVYLAARGYLKKRIMAALKRRKKGDLGPWLQLQKEYEDSRIFDELTAECSRKKQKN